MANGDPTGNDLASGTTDGSTLPEGSYEEREITFSAGYALESGRKYALIIRNSAPGSSDAITISGQIFPNANYANGYYADSSNAGASWSQDDWIDVWFKTKAGGVEKDTYTDTGWANSNVYGDNWYAMVFTASSAYTIDSVVLRLSGDPVGGTPGTITVSLRNVEGEETLPTKASTPAPASAAVDVSLNLATLTWADGGDTNTYNVYYGTESGNLSLVASGITVGNESFTVTDITEGAPYAHLVTRYWRIDSVNNDGTTQGDEWSFTTLQSEPPRKTWVTTISGSLTHYRLLVKADGTYGSHPDDGGVENTDYVVVTALPNFMTSERKLVAIAENRFWYEV